MQKLFLCVLLLLALPACLKRRKAKPVVDTDKTTLVKKSTDARLKPGIATDADALVLQDKAEYDLFNEEPEVKMAQSGPQQIDEEINWDEIDEEADIDTEVIHFDFDHYDIRPDQTAKVEANVPRAKEAEKQGATVVVEGHSCHIAKSKMYNYKLSEKRANEVADNYAQAGVAREQMVTVGRGDSMAVTDVPQEQHRNRRVETKMIYDKNAGVRKLA